MVGRPSKVKAKEDEQTNCKFIAATLLIRSVFSGVAIVVVCSVIIAIAETCAM